MAEFFERRPLFKSPIPDGPEQTQLNQLGLIVELTGAPTEREWLGPASAASPPRSSRARAHERREEA